MIEGWLVADVDRPLGRGGFGVVYRARHAALGVSAALKVMTHASWREPEGRRAFRDEVRAMGVLDHPNVVRVLDHGEVGAGGPLPEGAPWLVMELVDGGSLGATALGGWPALRAVLAGALDALAHAHARGLVHGDVSPANILVDGHGVARLTDFGLARAFAAESRPGLRESVVRGTRPYMAPEQREGRFRDFGPWTDLFGLGAVIWERVTGSPPRTSPPGPFQPSFPVPAGLEGWLRRLLEPQPGARWAWAADAAFALPSEEVAPAAVEEPVDATAPTATTTVTMETSGVEDAGATGATDVRSTAPPLPADPSPARELEPPALQLLRMGGGRPGLFGLRRLPFVGREAERGALWEALRGVIDSGRPDLVALTGPSGVGKTRLARWLLERAHEVGAAHALEVVADEGFAGLVRRAAVLGGLERAAAADRLRAWLRPVGLTDPWDADTLAALAVGGDVPPIDRRLAVCRLVERLAAVRPVVLLLDDADPDALAVAERLRGGSAPVLVLVTANDEALADRPTLGEALAAARRHPVPPLPAPDHAALVRALFGLAPDVAAIVEARTAGNPEFAVQLVGTWVDRGVLTRGPDGWRLREGVEAPVPQDLRASWEARLERFLAGEPPDSGPALEVAAALGQEVVAAEWREVLDRAGLVSPEGLAERLVAAGLAGAHPAGFAFAHAMARLALEHRAGARWAEWNDAAARWLCAAIPDDLTAPADALERAGRLLQAAGRAREAVAYLEHAAKERITRAEHRAALELALRVLALYRELGLPEADEAWGRAHHTVVDLRLTLGQLDVAREQVDAALEAAEKHGWTGARAWLYRDRGRISELRGDEQSALADYGRAHPLFEVDGDLVGQGVMLQMFGDHERAHGRLDAAIDLYARAADTNALAGQPDHVAVGLVSLGAALVARGRLAEAEAALERGLRVCADAGASQVEAYGTYFLAAVRVREGRLDEAEALAADAIARLDRLGNAAGVMYARGVVAHADRRRGRSDRALAALDEIVAFFDRTGSDDRLDFRAERAWARLDAGDDAGALAIVDELLGIRAELPPSTLGLVGLVGMLAAARLADHARYDVASEAAADGYERSGAADPERAGLARAAAVVLSERDRARAQAAARLAERIESAFSAPRPVDPAPSGPGGAAPRGA